MYSNGQKPIEDGWDWPWIIFIGIKELGMTERAVWKLTPRKFFALTKCLEIQNRGSETTDSKTGASQVKQGYVDQINW